MILRLAKSNVVGYAMVREEPLRVVKISCVPSILNI
jgi:hypothetical protein